MERQTFHVTTDDGIRISFDLYQKPGREAAVILCPGFFQSKETPTFQRLAKALTDSYDVLCIDFRGHGRSSGFYTFSAREHADLEAVLHWAKARYRNIGVIGFSLGAAIAIHTASRHPHGIQSVIAVSTPSSFGEIEFKFWTPAAMRTGIMGLERGAGCRPGNVWLRKDKPIDTIQRVSPVPVLLIHGTKDAIVSHRHSERLYPVAGEPKRLRLMEGGGHAEELFRDDPKRFLSLVQDWFETTLPSSPKAANVL